MNITEDAIRDLCTDAVYERGETYLAEGRIQQLSRFDDTITAVVSGSRDYDMTLDLSAEGFDPQCGCPYDGPGACKHVVAVLLRLADGLPADESERIDTVLERAGDDELRAFFREKLRTDPSLCDRLLARFGEPTTRSVDELRAKIDRLFEETNPDYAVVFEPIDFSEFFDLAEEHRARDEYRSAATVYRALVEGLDDNMDLVDGAYDHFAQAFQRALDGYVDCVVAGEFGVGETAEHVRFLEERAVSGTDYLRERFVRAADELRERTDTDPETWCCG
ncbi:SWIM zinc finger domain-containing protein [Salinirubellus sp. GCM10025818]|uniref:SWIM zinc finger family protein n=1 Tax=Salinirubellus TaxID=2162630 RepID=UPI00361F1473